MNKPQEIFEMIEKAGKESVNTMREFGELQMNTWNEMMNKQLELFNTVVASAGAQAQVMSEAKDMEEAVRTQVELNRQLGEEMIEKSRESLEMSQKAGEEYRAFAEGVMKQTAERFEAVKQAA